MMVWELGLLPVNSDPKLNGLITFFSFATFGLIPVLPFLIDHFIDIGTINIVDKVSLISTVITMFLLGVLTGKFTN